MDSDRESRRSEVLKHFPILLPNKTRFAVHAKLSSFVLTMEFRRELNKTNFHYLHKNTMITWRLRYVDKIACIKLYVTRLRKRNYNFTYRNLMAVIWRAVSWRVPVKSKFRAIVTRYLIFINCSRSEYFYKMTRKCTLYDNVIVACLSLLQYCDWQ